MKERILVNFREVLNLDHTIGGYVAKVTSPKGMKKTEGGRTHYYLKTESAGVTVGSEDVYSVYPGLYQVIDICKWNIDGRVQWNIYLVVIKEDGVCVPVAEYLDNPYTKWVKTAIKLVKMYFDGEDLPEIELTPQPKKAKSLDKRSDYFMNPPVTPKKKKKQEAEKPKTGTKKEENTVKKPRKKNTGRPQEKGELEYGYARLMTFTGMVTGVYKILRHSKKYIEVETQKGVLRFSKADGKQINAEKPRYANKIEWNLDK